MERMERDQEHTTPNPPRRKTKLEKREKKISISSEHHSGVLPGGKLETLRGGFLFLIRWLFQYPLVFGTYRLQNWLRAPFAMEPKDEDSEHEHRPGILVSNYGNYFFDNIIGLMIAPVWPFYFVRQCVYKIPVMNWVHRFFRAIPIVRNKEHRVSSVDREAFNNSVYDHVVDLLRHGHWLTLFPEQNSGHRSQILKPLRPGAAVIALRAEKESGWNLRLKIYVYGTNYENKFIGRSNVYLQWAEPIVVANYKSLYEENAELAAVTLMNDVEQALHHVVLQAKDAETLENAHRVAFQQKRASFSGVRAVIEEIESGKITPDRFRLNLTIFYESLLYQMVGFCFFVFGWAVGLPFRWFGRLCGKNPSEDMSYQFILWLMVLSTGLYIRGIEWLFIQSVLTWIAMDIWLWAWRRNVIKSSF